MKKIVSALLVSAAALSAPAFATGFEDGVVGTKYAVIDVGSISYGGLGSATAISVGGGYQVHPAVAVEAQYMMGSKLSYSVFGFSGFDYQLTALQITAVGNYNFGNNFSVYGKAGLAFNNQKATTNVFGFTASASQSSTDLTYAIGAKYNFNKDIAVRVQYLETGVSSVNVFSIGAMFNF